MEPIHSTKNIVLDFWRLAIGQGDLAFAEKIIADQYIQHSSMVRDGKKGILEALEALAKTPKPSPTPKPVMRIITDRDLAAVHMLLEMNDRKMVLLDLLRVEDGLLVEHWDAILAIPAGVGSAIIDGPTLPAANSDTNENKLLVHRYVRGVLIYRQDDTDFIADDFIDHDLYNCLQKCSFERLHRVIGEGDLIVTQATGTINMKPHVLYDIFRVSEKKIVEHWNVHQLIPEKMPHGNKMV